jgi:hypothetical protein
VSRSEVEDVKDALGLGIFSFLWLHD